MRTATCRKTGRRHCLSCGVYQLPAPRLLRVTMVTTGCVVFCFWEISSRRVTAPAIKHCPFPFTFFNEIYVFGGSAFAMSGKTIVQYTSEWF